MEKIFVSHQCQGLARTLQLLGWYCLQSSSCSLGDPWSHAYMQPTRFFSSGVLWTRSAHRLRISASKSSKWKRISDFWNFRFWYMFKKWWSANCPGLPGTRDSLHPQVGRVLIQQSCLAGWSMQWKKWLLDWSSNQHKLKNIWYRSVYSIRYPRIVGKSSSCTFSMLCGVPTRCTDCCTGGGCGLKQVALKHTREWQSHGYIHLNCCSAISLL